MKKLLLILALTLTVAVASATNLRGYLQHYNAYTGYFYSASGVEVGLYYQSKGEWVLAAYAISGYDGFYYFSNIYPGSYYLAVAGKYYPLYVEPMNYQDIFSITVGY